MNMKNKYLNGVSLTKICKNYNISRDEIKRRVIKMEGYK